MKKLILLVFSIPFCLSSLFATTTSSTTRNVSIDGAITTGATNGTNGTGWELDEEYLANDGAKFYLTWDNVNLYVAWKGGVSGHQRILWIDTDPKATPTNGTGLDSLVPALYGGISAKVPFKANCFLNFESSTVDRSYKYNADSAKWFKISNNAYTRTISADGTEYEAKIPWDSLGGRPKQIYFLSYINNKAGGGNVPANNDGFVYGGAPTTIAGGDFDNVLMAIDPANTWFAATIVSGVAPFSSQGTVLSVEGSADQTTPQTYTLDQNYPNPFNPSTVISYRLPLTGHVSLKVYDMIGREVATLVNEVKATGSYEVMFDASKLSSGIYFYQLKSGQFNSVKKMMLIK